MPHRVKIATLIAFGLHGLIILAGGSRLGYDAFTHMFFADHYLHSWWSLWETRWYTGFEVISYPPLVHQLIAFLARLVGVNAGYGLLLWLVVIIYPLAIYHFSHIFTGDRAAGYAAIGAAMLPSLFLSAHTFGQLPTLAATLLVLLSMRPLADFLQHGNPLSGALAISVFATLMAAHHATLLFLPWLVGAVFIRLFFQRKNNKRKLLVRLSVFTLCAGLAGLAVIWPFWNWGRSQVIQTPIDHASRHNFFADLSAAGMFFLSEYGLLIPFIPVALWLGRHKRFWGIIIAFLVLFMLGLGGTTPLPRLLFRSGWAWLTYDRFAFWASLLLLPFMGLAVTLAKATPRFVFTIFWSTMALTALVIGLMQSWLPTQPRQIDMQPIINFLAQGDHAQYRYVTFGFGDQLAYLSRLTIATTIDGSYHTARALPELRSSGISQIDSTFWLPGGMAALDPILKISGERGVRWGFVELKSYEPVLQRFGWNKLTTLENDVAVWENPSAILPPLVDPPVETPFEQFSWGVFPLLSFFISGGLTLRRYWPAAGSNIFSIIQAFAIGLLPFGLTFWYYRALFAFPHFRIYFTYSDALFFLSDGLVVVAVLTWMGQYKFPSSSQVSRSTWIKAFFHDPTGWLFCLCLLATLSTLWSLDWRISLYSSLHFWLLFVFYLSLRLTPRVWHWFLLGGCAALVAQIVIGIWQFAVQSTAMTLPLKLDWPGKLLPSITGASVVQLANGVRWLRVYGTLPHPNLLGGFGFVLIATPLALFLFSKKWRIPALILFNLGLALLVLTFSRSAWLGFMVLCIVLIYHRKNFSSKQILPLLLTMLLTLGCLLIRFYPLFFSRLADNQIQTEQVSNYTRYWLILRTLELIRGQPILGSGVATYSLALSNHVAQFYKIEPVHNILLLVTSELGISGLMLLVGLVVTVVWNVLKAHKPAAIVPSGILLGLLTIGLFDHYFWTLAPGRALLFTVMGLWAGQMRNDERRC